ncbi:MAG: hypothetical protein OXH09_06215 [Gammaproteobacteria bacterium]|nr:hypothetical protein [Gammaproteobacteria bacterium]
MAANARRPKHHGAAGAHRQGGQPVDQLDPIERRAKPGPQQDLARQVRLRIAGSRRTAGGRKHFAAVHHGQTRDPRQAGLPEGIEDPPVDELLAGDQRALDETPVLAPHVSVEQEVVGVQAAKVEGIDLALKGRHDELVETFVPGTFDCGDVLLDPLDTWCDPAAGQRRGRIGAPRPLRHLPV